MYDPTIRGETLNMCEPSEPSVSQIENVIHDRLVELYEVLGIIGSSINKNIYSGGKISEGPTRDSLINALMDDSGILSNCLVVANGIRDAIG